MITVISTKAIDVICDRGQESRRKGGPARFIIDYLESAGADFRVLTGAEGEVRIEMDGGIERGAVFFSTKMDLPEEKIDGLTLLSTISDEIPIRALGDMNCIDIQGFIRSGKRFSPGELDSFDIVKGTKQELEGIEGKSLFIETDGKRGFRIINGNQISVFVVDEIDAPDTIGAGDTFFAAFCLQYWNTADIGSSASAARDAVYSLLRGKEGTR